MLVTGIALGKNPQISEDDIFKQEAELLKSKNENLLPKAVERPEKDYSWAWFVAGGMSAVVILSLTNAIKK